MNEQMIRKNNMKIFPFYKMFAWDLLFYFAISFLFLTQVKGFTASQVLLIDSIYSFFRIISQIFCIKIVDTIGKQKALLLGNALVSTSILMLILGNNFLFLVFLHLIQAVGYNLHSLCEPTILSDSIPKSSFSSNIYSKIDGKGNSLYYIFDAVSSISTGFLYVINPYLPMILCFICCLISTIICLGFNDPVPEKKSKEKKAGFFDYYKDMIITFKQIIKSKRLKSLLIFSFCSYGVLYVFGTLRSSILVDINVPEQYFGIILAVMQIISSISARNQNWFHKKLRNRALTWFSLSVALSFIITGLLVTCNISYAVSIMCVLLTIVIVGIVKGCYYTLMSKYYNSFSNPNVNTKIFAIKSLVENLGNVVISYFASFLLGITTTSYAFIILGCSLFIIFIFLLDNMKTKLGLKPEEYSKEDLVFSSEAK